MRSEGTGVGPKPTAVELCRRPVGAGDREFLAGLYASTRADELAVTGWADEVKAAFLRQQFEAQDHHYRTYFQDASFEILESGGEPVGRFYVVRWAHEIRLVDIALLPAAQRRGIGSQLLGELVAEGRASGRKVSCHVEVFNQALELYRRVGFMPAGEQGPYLLMEWAPVGQARGAQEG